MLKSIKVFSILAVIVIMLVASSDVDAQRKRGTKKRSKKTSKVENTIPLKDRLWYGSNINFQLSNNYFLFGLNPMVGYKFNNWLSAGPTVIANYSHVKYIFSSNNIYNLKSFDYGLGLFTRAKFLNQFFIQAEFDYTSKSEIDLNEFNNPQPDPDDPNDYLTKREPISELFIGIGYHSSQGAGTWGYQATLMYDILKEDTSQSLPITYRIGFTYNL